MCLLPAFDRFFLQISAANVEYGELKTAYVYPVSVDNKAGYCALHDCDVVVGGTVPECSGRSARWNKVAWLRRSFFRYSWLVWMDVSSPPFRRQSVDE